MNKSKIIKVFSVMIIIGILLIICGFILEPDVLKYSMYYDDNGFHFSKDIFELQDFNTFEEWDRFNWNLLVFFGKKGNDIKQFFKDEFEYDTSGIEEIEIESVTTSVKIIEDDIYNDGKIHFSHQAYGEKIINEKSGDIIKIKTKKSSPFIDKASGVLIIYIPKLSPLDYSIKTVSGNVSINLDRPLEEVEEIEIETVSGQVEINTQIAEKVDSNTISGNLSVNVYDVKEIKLETTSGNVEVIAKRSVGKLDIGTISGESAITVKDIEEVEIDSASGNIDINIIENIASLYLESKSGNVYMDSVELGKSYTKKYGKGTINAKTLSGDIKLENRDN